MIKQLSDHTGIQPDEINIDGNNISVQIKKEMITRADWVSHDYNVHFCFGLFNDSGDAQDLEISVNNAEWDNLPEIKPLIYVSENNCDYSCSKYDAKTDLGKKYYIKATLQPRQKVYFANTLVRDHKKLNTNLDKIGLETGARRLKYGVSLQNRDLISFVYGNVENNPAIIVTSGFHPPEPDTLATQSIMEWLGTEEGKNACENYSFVIIPIVNPDGYVFGTQGSNAAGINMYWYFNPDIPEKCPEAKFLWNYARELKPVLYIDFHSYTFQLKKQAGPYVRPAYFYNNKIAKDCSTFIYSKISEKLDTRRVSGFPAYAPSTLGSMLANMFDTITLAKYHIHLKEGEVQCKLHSLEVLRIAIEGLNKYGIHTNSELKSGMYYKFFKQAIIYWAGMLRPAIGNLRRARFKKVRFDRERLERP